MGWASVENRALISDNPYEKTIGINDILVRVQVVDKPTWNYAGEVYISDDNIILTGLITKRLYLGVRELIQVASVTEYLQSTMTVSYHPKSWIADYGYDLAIWEWV